MFCTKCKKQNKDDASFCVYCGSALRKEARISRMEIGKRCCLCDKELTWTEGQYTRFGSPQKLCEGCVGKFKQAKKELPGKSDSEIISSIRLRESHPHQPEAVTTTSEAIEAIWPGLVQETSDAVKAKLVLTLKKIVDARTAEMTPLEPREKTEGAGLGTMWEYRHIFIAGATARESGEGVSRATMPMVGRYEPLDIQRRLQAYGREGWELVCMEPQWFWERVGISMAMEITRPRVITGWYCTFKRKVKAA